MTRRKRSFENQLINIFWGLTKGSRLLKPYSNRFKEMGFKIVVFEQQFFTTQNRRVTPDMVVESVELEECILAEWTQEREISDRKREQLCKLVNIDEGSLRDSVSEACVRNKDVILIITLHSEESFKRFIKNSDLPIILLVYHYPSDYLLEKKFNHFSVDETEHFFNQRLKFRKIPYSFPDINLSNLSESLIVDKVIWTLTIILVKKEEGFEFNIEYFVKRMLTESFYDLLSERKRREIIRASKDIINELLRRRYGIGILERIRPDPPTWRVILPQQEKFRKIRLIERRFQRFINEITGRPVQPSLFNNFNQGGES